MYILWSYWSILFWACNFARYEGFSISSLYHGKNYFDWKQATFSDCFFITVSSSACNFAENRPRVGRKRAYTVKIFNEVIRYCCFFFSKLYLTHKHENFVRKIFPLAIIDCMEYAWTHNIFKLTRELRLADKLLIRTLYPKIEISKTMKITWPCNNGITKIWVGVPYGLLSIGCTCCTYLKTST